MQYKIAEKFRKIYHKFHLGHTRVQIHYVNHEICAVIADAITLSLKKKERNHISIKKL